MKVFASLVVASYGQYNTTYPTDVTSPEETTRRLQDPPIWCWTCNAKNAGECRREGKFEQCMDNEQVCEIEIRKRDGRMESVSTGCKWRRACLDNTRQNFINDPYKHQHQCKPAKWHLRNGKGPSVCRQCCNDDKLCGLEWIERNKGKGPFNKPIWRKNYIVDNPDIDPPVCTIPSTEPKVTITTLTGSETNADSNAEKLFRFVRPGCKFDWIVMDRDGIDDFEKNATDVFEYDMAAIHPNPHCLQGIKKIEIKDESDQGWKAEWVDVFINNVAECETADLEFDGGFWVDLNETTRYLTAGETVNYYETA